MFDVEEFITQVKQLICDRDIAYREWCDDICLHCKNKIDCNGETCSNYVSGNEGFLNGKQTKFKWDCRDFDYGSCPEMENTPCFECFKDDYSGFVYNGTEYDFDEALSQIEEFYKNVDISKNLN